MKLENGFSVSAPIERAWEVLLDVERVAPCLPGAALEGRDGDDYRGTMTVKLGPITSRYTGTLRIEEADEQARRAVMRADARDARGQGTAAGTIVSTMTEVDGGTQVQVETDLRITGPAAQFGRGIMQDVSAKLMTQFAECLARTISGPDEPEPAAPEGAPGEQDAGEGGAAETRTPSTTTAPRGSVDVLDLGAASRDAVLRRAVPAAVALLSALFTLRLLRRRRA
jgi:carbon monoxide dehydrogenase subunit G